MTIYQSDDITVLKIYSHPNGTERIYWDGYWLTSPENLPSVKQYMDLMLLAETNETVRLHLEQLKVIYGLARE